ncbi:hypothetical protein [Kribbella rubisoli]|uniref:hypothetical protein n=1 Tax=Kribbella rubisoli TaxID=3075929 RepID=UPI001F542BF9|nr:hypothetical protein [Kribbella rubisoli]
MDEQGERLPVTDLIRYVDRAAGRRDGVLGVPAARLEDGGEDAAARVGAADDLDTGDEGELDAAAVRTSVRCVSAKFTPAAVTSTRSWSGPATGGSSSVGTRTSGPPNWVTWIARMGVSVRSAGRTIVAA